MARRNDGEIRLNKPEAYCGGHNPRRQNMENNITAMLDEISIHRAEIKFISEELMKEVLKIPGIEEAITSGLVKLNFPAPPNFHRMLKNKNK